MKGPGIKLVGVQMNKDPKSEKFKSCPAGCGCKDIRVHFTVKPDGTPAEEMYHIHWCMNCGSGTNQKKGLIDMMLFGSCVEQMKGHSD